MKPLHLPSSTAKDATPLNNCGRRLVIIGANGAGKTRFTESACRLSAPDAVLLSALNGIYKTSVASADGDYYDRLFVNSYVSEAEKQRSQTRLERLLALLMHDELINLLKQKIAKHADAIDKKLASDIKPLSKTRLDSIIEIFQEIFPTNTILIDNGRFRFRSSNSESVFPALRLSDGERTVLYYIASVLYAPPQVNIFVESPEIFLHPTTIQALWNRLERLRRDCRFIYATHDLDFAASRQGAQVIWVRGRNFDNDTYDYVTIPPDSVLGEGIYMAIIGARRNVLFIEGDSTHSLDAKLYPLLFPNYTVKSVGSCDRVIEATRTFNSLTDFHHTQAMGIVDRDRRTDSEVSYLRRRNVLVPEVAEIENIFMLPEVIDAVAVTMGCDDKRVTLKVKNNIIAEFSRDLKAQALEHTRHTVKGTVEHRIDGRFASIGQFEEHLTALTAELDPRRVYEQLCRQFHTYVDEHDYRAILRVYNHKSMIAASGVAQMCSLGNKNGYINKVLDILASNGEAADKIRTAALRALMPPQAPDSNNV